MVGRVFAWQAKSVKRNRNYLLMVPKWFFFVHYLIWIYFIDVLDQYSQKSTPYLFQNNVPLYLEPYWKQNNADIKVWYFIKLKWLTFPMKKETNFPTGQVKGYDFKKWTRDCRWQWHTPVKKRIKHKLQALELQQWY